MEMQADSVEPEKSDFLQPLDSEIQTWMSKAFDVVKLHDVVYYLFIVFTMATGISPQIS